MGLHPSNQQMNKTEDHSVWNDYALHGHSCTNSKEGKCTQVGLQTCCEDW